MMKKNLYIIAAMSAAFALAACQKEQTVSTNTITQTVTIEESEYNPIASKTAYQEGVGVKFTGNEVMSVFYAKSGEKVMKQIPAKSDIVKNDDGTYTISHPAIEGATAYDYYCVLGGRQTEVGGRGKVLLVSKVSPFQTPEENTYDPTCDYLVGKPALAQEQHSSFTASQFKRVTCPLRIQLTDSHNVLSGTEEKIYLVNLSFSESKSLSTVLSGNGYITFDGDAYENTRFQSISSDGWSNTITASYPSGLTTRNIWYSVFPGSFIKGTMTISVVTANKTFSRTVNLSKEKGVILAEGCLNTLTFDISGEGYSEVESVYQDFTAITLGGKITRPLKFKASDGQTNEWLYDNCTIENGNNTIYKGVTRQIYPKGIYFAEQTSKMTFPQTIIPEGKKISKVMVYYHPIDNKSAFTVKTMDKNCLEITEQNKGIQTNWNTEFIPSKKGDRIAGIGFEFENI